jgi:DNA repair protein RadD
MTGRLIKLRDYQGELVDRARLALRKNRRVLIQLPTGGGKTPIAGFIAGETSARGKTAFFNCHRRELVQQTSLTFNKFGIPHGFIAAGKRGGNANVNICSIDTLKNRLATTPEPDVALWDEAHHLGAAGWRLVMDTWRRARHIGFTATPWRLDGSGLDDQFDEMVCGPSSAWLIERGYLSQYEIFAPFAPDMTGVKRHGGDYAKGEASKRMDIPKRTGDIIKHWRRYADGLVTVGFAVNVADSQLLAERFNAAGIPAAHLDAGTPKGERKRIIDAYAAGRLRVIWNVDLFGEGFDLSAIAQTDVTIDCVIQARPTQSLSLHLQQIGRALRPKEGPAIILDHAGNSSKHGFPDDEREWTLAGREKSGKGGDSGPPPPVTCEGCWRQIRRPLPPCCPHCGLSLAAKAKEIKEGEGELVKLTAADKAAMRQAREQEEHQAKTLPELLALAHRRGYANPQQWALKKFGGRAARQRHAKRIAAG